VQDFNPRHWIYSPSRPRVDSVPVPVVNVRVMPVRVHKPLVPVWVSVRLTGRVGWRVLVPVVLIVTVSMFVEERFVFMRVFVTLGQMQPQTHGHQQPRRHQPGGNRLAQ